MKIEKINDRQIRCTLTRNDLASRQIDLTELAYGTEKSRQLFQEMMEQANEEVGFDVEDSPLIVEAIPLSTDSLMLVITKADNPDELDPRFAKFAPVSASDAFNQTAFPTIAPSTLEEASPQEAASGNVIRIFHFSSLDEVTGAARMLEDVYFGINSLYKDPDYHDYYLAVSKSGHSLDEFNRTCNILSEYAVRVSGEMAVDGFMSEHFDVIVENQAVQVMSQL